MDDLDFVSFVNLLDIGTYREMKNLSSHSLYQLYLKEDEFTIFNKNINSSDVPCSLKQNYRLYFEFNILCIRVSFLNSVPPNLLKKDLDKLLRRYDQVGMKFELFELELFYLYSILFDLEGDREKFRKSNNHLLELAESYGFLKYIGISFLRMGSYQKQHGKSILKSYDIISSYNEALRIFREIEDRDYTITTLYNLVSLYFEDGHIESSLRYAIQSKSMNNGLVDSFDYKFHENYYNKLIVAIDPISQLSEYMLTLLITYFDLLPTTFENIILWKRRIKKRLQIIKLR